MKMGNVLLTSFVDDERGTTAIEYVMVATVVAMAVFGAIGLVGNGAADLFNAVSERTAESFSNSSDLMN